MSRPWMPLYVADYLRDTRRLTAAEHGAYLLLIMEYWTVGKLPDDDKQLCRIACMSAGEWRKASPNIQGYFKEGWSGHKRIDAELAKSAEISSKRSASAKQKHSKSSANAQQMNTHAGATSQPQSPFKKDSEAKASAPVVASIDGEITEAAVYRFGDDVLGQNSGGQVTKLRKMFSNDARKVYDVLAQAKQKGNARQWIAGVLKGSEFAIPTADEICPPDIYENVL
jgi:uncharacterized protein YdaU (DUF1376 family)